MRDDNHMSSFRYRFDMIHHNPGEAPFETAFSEPEHLLAYGYNGQAFKHINTIVTLDAVAPGVFPATEEERNWLEAFTAERVEEIRAAKAAGLEVYYHIDLFVLPQRIVDEFRDDICDLETGRISLLKTKTLELHAALFEELFFRFPEIDGLIMRVGETYLFDTPFHTGNGAVHYTEEISVETKQAHFKLLLNFLREQICVKHERRLIHRTWDTWPNRFHANRDFYLEVTDAIEPHPNLIFSIKHTQVDFHRWVNFNPSLGQGRHSQVIEVQCQREYEGKGAYPNYAAYGVLKGFPEMPEGRRGIAELVGHPLIQGVYTWSRGGGWHGPYVDRRKELWCDLNAYVIGKFAEDPSRSEEELFHAYSREVLRFDAADTAKFREIALRALDAVVQGKCCAAWETRPKGNVTYPTNQWMRDDVLHGLDKLEPIFDYLATEGKLTEALAEKESGVAIWRELRELARDLVCTENLHAREVIITSVEYGCRLFTAISAGWACLAAAHQGENAESLQAKLDAYRQRWVHYEGLRQEYPLAASLYRPVGWHWPGESPAPGLAASIEAVAAAPVAVSS